MTSNHPEKGSKIARAQQALADTQAKLERAEARLAALEGRTRKPTGSPADYRPAPTSSKPAAKPTTAPKAPAAKAPETPHLDRFEAFGKHQGAERSVYYKEHRDAIVAEQITRENFVREENNQNH